MGDMMRYIIDRFESDYVVLEDENGNISNISREYLPEEVKEGSIIYYVDGKYLINTLEEEKRRNYIREKMNSLWND